MADDDDLRALHALLRRVAETTVRRIAAREERAMQSDDARVHRFMADVSFPPEMSLLELVLRGILSPEIRKVLQQLSVPPIEFKHGLVRER